MARRVKSCWPRLSHGVICVAGGYDESGLNHRQRALLYKEGDPLAQTEQLCAPPLQVGHLTPDCVCGGILKCQRTHAPEQEGSILLGWIWLWSGPIKPPCRCEFPLVSSTSVVVAFLELPWKHSAAWAHSGSWSPLTFQVLGLWGPGPAWALHQLWQVTFSKPHFLLLSDRDDNGSYSTW